MTRLIGYIRVSTDEQNPARQVDAMEAAGCDLVFSEVRSALDDRRPELERAIAELQAGDVLVVENLARAARSTRHTWEIIDAIMEKGAEIRSLTEPIDSTTADGRLLINARAMVHQHERERMIERTRAGLEAAKKRGQPLGRPRAVAGEREAEALALLKRGYSQKRVARLMGVSTRTIRRLVARERDDSS